MRYDYVHLTPIFFLSSKCTAKCLRSQLNNYYNKACKEDGFLTRKTDGMGKVNQPAQTENNATLSN